jgi:hypothetical protein
MNMLGFDNPAALLGQNDCSFFIFDVEAVPVLQHNRVGLDEMAIPVEHFDDSGGHRASQSEIARQLKCRLYLNPCLPIAINKYRRNISLCAFDDHTVDAFYELTSCHAWSENRLIAHNVISFIPTDFHLLSPIHEHPLVLPQVLHFMQVPLRTSVKFPQEPQASPS